MRRDSGSGGLAACRRRRQGSWEAAPVPLCKGERARTMFETFLVPFDYAAILQGRPRGAKRTASCRATAAVEIEKVRAEDVEIAYCVKHEGDLGKGRHEVVRKDGKLWWPLADTALIVWTKDAGDFLRELRSGQSDLFVRGGEAARFRQENVKQRQVVRDTYDETLAELHRSAKNLLIVDDRLFAAGGVPMVVEYGGVRIASTGNDRGAAPRCDLRVKPANGHNAGVQLAICRGRFYLPDSPELDRAIKNRPFDFRGIRVDTIQGDEVDPLVVRIDAAFRTAWIALNASIPRTRPLGFARLHATFSEACGSSGGDRLTAARYFALWGFVDLFDKRDGIPVKVGECLDGVRRTLALASGLDLSAGTLSADSAPTLTEDEDAVIASLVSHGG